MSSEMKFKQCLIILLATLFCCIGSVLLAQQTATTQNGKVVILYEYGTWKYLDSSSDQQSDLQSLTVYATKTRKKYHAAGCRYLSKRKYPIALKDAVGTYRPCSVCNPARQELKGQRELLQSKESKGR